jgi:hypothetical protein
VVDLSGGAGTSYGIAAGITPKNLAEIEAGGSGLAIPRGVDTTKIELGPDLETEMSRAMAASTNATGNRAYQEVGRGYSEPSIPASETPIDANVGGWTSPEVAEAAEQFEAYKNVYGEAIPEEAEISKIEAAKLRGIEAATNCMLGGKT